MAISDMRIDNLVAALERLSKRERYMVGAVAIVFVLFVSTLVTMWVSSTLKRLERQIADKTTKLQVFIDQRQAYDEAKEAQHQAKRNLRQGESIKLMGTIDNMAKQLGVMVEDMKPRTAAINSEAGVLEEKVEVNIKLITIDRLMDFLQQIERRAHTIAVRKLHVKRSFQQPDQLEVGLTVSNFKPIKEKPSEGGPATAAKAPNKVD